MGDTSGSLAFPSYEAGIVNFSSFSSLETFKNFIFFISIQEIWAWRDRTMARTRGTARLPAADRAETSLDAAMRAPSTTTPDVVVLDFVDEDVKPKEAADPKKDLWLSTVDG